MHSLCSWHRAVIRLKAKYDILTLPLLLVVEMVVVVIAVVVVVAEMAAAM